MEQNKKRLSILKKAVRYESSPTQTFTKSNRRISFSGTKSVKEFIPGEDKATIWGTSYEEEDGNQGSGTSIQDNSTVETFRSFTNNKFGMTLRNRKIIQPKIRIEDKENISTEITMDTQILATTGDYQSFNSTLDVTLNSIEIKKDIKTRHDGISTKTGTSSDVKQLGTESYIAKKFHSSFIREEDRQMILQTRVAKKSENAIDITGNNDSSEFLKEMDKLTFEDPHTRHILGDKNHADSMNMSLSISPIISTDLSKIEINSDVRKTIVFQQGQVIASVEPENGFKDFNSARIRRTALLNEDLILDTPIVPRTNVDKRKPVIIKEPLTSKEAEVVIDDVNENSSMDRKQSGVNSKRKTIIFQGDDSFSFEIDQQKSVEVEREIQLNPPSRKTIIFPTGEMLQAFIDEDNIGIKSKIQKPQQTIILDSSEKLDGDVQSKPCMAKNSECKSHVFEGLDMEVDQNFFVEPAQSQINTHQANIEGKNRGQSNAPNRKTILFPKGEKLESCFDDGQTVNNENPLHQMSRQTFIYDKGENVGIFSNISDVDMEIDENTPAKSSPKVESKIQSNPPSRKTIIFPAGERLQSNRTVGNNDRSENRKTINIENDIAQTESSQCRNVLTKKNKKDNPYVSFPLDKENVLDIYASENQENIFDLKGNFEDEVLDFKQNDARKTTLFQRGEPIEGIDEAVRGSNIAIIEPRISKNEARKTLIFQHGEPLESCETEVYTDKARESALNINRFERRKTKIFNETEFLDMTENEILSDSDDVSKSKANENREILDQCENNRWKYLSTVHGNEPQEIKVQQHVSEAELLCNEIVPAINFVSRIDARKTKILQHGEIVEEINVKSIQKVSSDSKDIRKTTLFHKDLDESGLAFLEPDNSSRPPSRQMITSCDNEIEIDRLSSSQQQHHTQKTWDSIRNTNIFRQAINMNNTSCQENTNKLTKSSNPTASVGVLNLGSQQGLTDGKQNILPSKMEIIEENACEKLGKKSKQVMNTEKSVDQANYKNSQRKTFVFDNDMEIEISVVLNKNTSNQDALSKETISHTSSSKTLLSTKPVEVNQLKLDIRDESKELQSNHAIHPSILPKDSYYKDFIKQIQAQSLENRKISDACKTVDSSKIEHNTSNTTKGAIPKVGLSSNQECDLSFDCSFAPDHLHASVNDKSQRKTIFFQGNEHVHLNESTQNQKRVIQKQRNGNNILRDAKHLTTFGQTQSIKQADTDIIVDSIPSSCLVGDHHVVKDKNKRKTIIFPEGEAIEEESEITKDRILGDTPFMTNEAHLSEYIFPTKQKENSPQPIESIQNCRITSFINKDKITENAGINNEEHMRTENNFLINPRESMRKTVIIENSPSKQVYLSQSTTELLETSSNNYSNKSHADISIFHTTKDFKDMELDEVPSIEKESTETFSRHNKNRKTVYLNEDIGAAIETSFSCSSPDKDNILQRSGQFSLARNESKNNIQSGTNNQSTFIVPRDIGNQINENTQNESFDPVEKCLLSSRPKNRETYTIHNETNKSRNETFAAKRETFVVSRNKEKCDLAEPSTRKTFENNSSTASNIEPRLPHNVPQDSIYFSRTTNSPMAGMESFQVTGSSFYYSPNSTAALCNLDPDQITGAGYKRTHIKNFASENTFSKQFKRDYAEISIDAIRDSPDQYSEINAAINEDIDKTHIDLVETIETIEDSPEKVYACEASVMILNATEANQRKANVQSINIEQQQNFLCRKCNNCQKTIFNETTLNETTLSDFNQVENEPEVELDFSALDRLKGIPNYRQVWNEFQEKRRSWCFNTTVDEPLLSPTVPSIEFLLINSEEEFRQSLNEELRANEFTGAVCPTDMPLWFLFENRLLEKSVWNWYDLNLPIGVLECRHHKVKGIRLLFRFDAKDLYNPDASDFYFKKVSLDRSNGYRDPSPIEKAVQNEILLRLPRELTGFCSAGSELFTYLEELEETFTKCRQLVKNLLIDTYLNDALFECDESGNCIIRKTVFNDTRPEYGYKIEFRIRVRNIEKICAKDILLPPQSFFKDSSSLPTGLQFVKSFLSNPVQYLK